MLSTNQTEKEQEKRSNKSVLEEIGKFKGLVNQIEQKKPQFIGHIMRHRCIENDILTGMVFGKRPRGRQKTRLTNIIKERLGLTLTVARAFESQCGPPGIFIAPGSSEQKISSLNKTFDGPD